MRSFLMVSVAFGLCFSGGAASAQNSKMPQPQLRNASKQLLQMVNAKKDVSKFRDAFYVKAHKSLIKNKLQSRHRADGQWRPEEWTSFRQVTFDALEDGRMRQTYYGTKQPQAVFAGVLAPEGRTVTVRLWYDKDKQPVGFEGIAREKGQSLRSGRQKLIGEGSVLWRGFKGPAMMDLMLNELSHNRL